MDMFDAANAGDIERIKVLLDEGIDINSKNEFDQTPLLRATKNSNATSSLETVKFLLDRGADVNAKDISGWTALMWASESSNATSSLETVKLLLDRGANIDAQQSEGWTALMFATRYSNSKSSVDTVKLLLDRGANINIQNNDKWPILFIAITYSDRESSLDAAKLLLERGADPFVLFRQRGVVDTCPTRECKTLMAKYVWSRLYQRDKDLAIRYSKSGDIRLPKDVWEIILLNKRQQLLCQNLNNNKNKEVLILFAIELEIPITEKTTKGQLCGLISRQLAYGKGNNKTKKDMDLFKKQILEIAMKLNINTNTSLEQIMINISKAI